MSESREISYVADDSAELWRCNIYMFRNGSIYPLLAIFTILTVIPLTVLGIFSFYESVGFALFMLVFPPVMSWLMVKSLVRNKRSCTTTVSEAGVYDKTYKFNETRLPWKKVRKIEMENGSIFFVSPWLSSVYIPSYAFEDQQAALEFYRHSQKLWNEARTQGAQRLSSWAEDEALKLEDQTKKQIEDFEAEEDAAWKLMEEEHRKQQEKGS